MVEYADADNQFRFLLDMVADIAGEHDSPQHLLDCIADRARRLLSADVAYLWLLEHADNVSRLGATSGGMSADLLDLRVPAGQAMTGRIVETRMPLIVSNYQSDRIFKHYPQIDLVMAQEDIQAAVGVPLVTDSATLGALIVANRDQRTYSLGDVAALRALATHATIAILRSRTAAENARRLATAEPLILAYKAIADSMVTSGDIDILVRHASGLVDGVVSIHDLGGRLLAGERNSLGPNHTARLIEETATTHQIVQTSDGSAALPVSSSDRVLAILCFQPNEARGTICETTAEILHFAAQAVGVLLVNTETEAGIAGFGRDDFIDELMRGDDTPGRLLLRGDRLRIDLRKPHTVHVIHAPAQPRRLAHLANEAARMLNGLAGQCHGFRQSDRPPVVALVPGSDAATNGRMLAEAFERFAQIKPTVGGSGPCVRLSEMKTHYIQAFSCTNALVRIGGGQVAGTIDDLGFIGLLVGENPDIERFIQQTLQAVITYDTTHNAELLTTLEALTMTSGAPTATAEALHLHVNTVKQRMQRITNLLGSQWRTVDGLAEIRIAIKLHRLRDGRPVSERV